MQEPVPQASPRRRKWKGSLLALLIVAALGGLAWYLTHRPAAETTAPRPGGGRGGAASTVGVATAERSDLPVVLEALGTVTTPATATVRAQVSGVLQKVLYREGQVVKAGDLLAEVDPRQFDMALQQATGQLQRDEAQLDNAKITLKRYQTLLAQDSIARQEVETQAALVKQLEGTVTADRAATGTARLNLGYTKVKAPISGRIGLRVVDIGNVVGPNDSGGIAVITQLQPIDVEFAVPQDQAGALRLSESGEPMTVTVLDRSRAEVLDTGRFLALDNQVDPQTGTVRAKARFANAKMQLFPSQFVNARLLVRTISGAVTVPVTALRHGSNGDFVYVLNAAEKTVSLRTVKAGQVGVDKVEIASGLKVGEQVITEGADRLKDGARVTLPGDRPAAGGPRQGGRPGGAQGGGRQGGMNGAGAARSGTDAPSERVSSGTGDAAAGAGASAGAGAGTGAGGKWRNRQGEGGAAPASAAPTPGSAAPADSAGTPTADGGGGGRRRRSAEAASQ